LNRIRQFENTCMATLTTGGLMGDDLLLNGSSFPRSIGHRIYVPAETTFVNALRYQTNKEHEDKPPSYVTNLDDPTT